MIEPGQIFVSKQNYIFVYESWFDASDASGSQYEVTSYSISRKQMDETLPLLVNYLREINPNPIVFYTVLGEPILLLHKENNSFWQVLVGERVGWIMPDIWLKLELLKENDPQLAAIKRDNANR